MRDINNEELEEKAPYLAGLMDGEGTYTLRPITRGKHLNFSALICLSMTDEKTVKFAANVFGVTYAKKVKKRPYKDYYFLRVTTKYEIKQIANALLRHSITKADQIELLLSFYLLEYILPEDFTDPSYQNIMEKIIDLYILLKKSHERGSPPDYEALRETLKQKI
jgi:hypothetical protein